ncbi:MAG: PH domain-containing protein [Alphaproteobacteria bacterium PRO2]|nr:PH domain-containing protein [Alphaproteobacteria bacterium PRO2]
MSFVKKILGPDETLIGMTSAHWIYGATGIVWLAGMMIVGLVLDSYATSIFDGLFRNTGGEAVNKISSVLFWMPTALGVVMFFFYFLMMISPEVGLTSRRIIYKRGLIFVDVKEVDLEEIKAADVNNGWFGRFLDYGYVVLDARFVTGVNLPAIGKPYRFVNALNEARGDMKHDSMTVVVDGVGDSLREEVGDAVRKEMSDHDQKREKKQQEQQESETKESGERPKLSDRHHNDHLEHEPVSAMEGVIEEAKDNLKHAINGKVMVPASESKPEPESEPQHSSASAPEKKKRGPLLFNHKLFKKERWLRAKIKDNFSETAQ